MIHVVSALKKIDENSSVLPSKKISLSESLNYTLAVDILSPIDMPPFRQSAMDGYAIHFSEDVESYQLIGEIAAGSNFLPELKKGEAVRIFTGAPVPDSCNTVVQQEMVIRENEKIFFNKEIKIGSNIRPLGEQIERDEIALRKNTLLTPAAIGYLATLGITEIEVYRKPKIALLTTGNELQKPGEKLQPGQIYESNSEMLQAASKNYGFEIATIKKCKDDLDDTAQQIDSLLSNHDVIFISGGISVGDYDYVKPASERCGVKEVFYKIKQKPGKPIYFGKKGDQLIFAFPGNPASALTCFYIYALPALMKLSGKGFTGLEQKQAKLQNNFSKKKGLTHFLKGDLRNSKVEILSDQSSAMLNSYAVANCLVMIPEETEELLSGDVVTVFIF